MLEWYYVSVDHLDFDLVSKKDTEMKSTSISIFFTLIIKLIVSYKKKYNRI